MKVRRYWRSVRWPYSVKLFDEEVEQIDGAVHCLGLSCLVESKDFADEIKVNIAPIAKLRNQLLLGNSSGSLRDYRSID